MDFSKISLAEYMQRKKEAMEAKMAAGKKVIMPELLEFLVTLGTEGERSAVVLGAERVHMAVQGLLAGFLTPSNKKEDDIFKGQGVLASFAKKTEMAYRLGLMDLKMRQALDMV